VEQKAAWDRLQSFGADESIPEGKRMELSGPYRQFQRCLRAGVFAITKPGVGEVDAELDVTCELEVGHEGPHQATVHVPPMPAAFAPFNGKTGSW
jgi:hypothetical protein